MVLGDVFISHPRDLAGGGHGHVEELPQRVVPVQACDVGVVGALQDRRPLDVRGVLHEGFLQTDHAVGACSQTSYPSVSQAVRQSDVS